jgi:catechol 2,3-dioxygenase-like lactoylglutathione lyase family enzyme
VAIDPLDALRLPVVPVDPRPRFAAGLLRQIAAATGGRTDPAALRENPTVRYFVDDLAAAIAFYCGRLGFDEELRSAPAFAMLYRGGLRLLLSVPGGPGAGAPPPRITIQVTDIAGTVEALRREGVRVRADVSAGIAVSQALIEDPSGNLVELIEPAAGYRERT